MEETLTYIGFGVFFVPLLTGIARWRRLSRDQRTLVAWVGFVIPFSVVSEVVGRRYGNNLPLYHIYTFLEFAVLYYLFRRSLRRLPALVSLLPILLFVGVALWGIIRDPYAFPDRTRTIESITFIGCALLFCYQSLHDLEARRIDRTFMFWLGVAVLLYFTGNLLLYVFSNYIAEASDAVYFTVWTIHTVFNILLYLLYSVALSCKDPTPPSSQSSSSAH